MCFLLISSEIELFGQFVRRFAVTPSVLVSLFFMILQFEFDVTQCLYFKVS